MDVPKYDELMNPMLEALRSLGGSAANSELDEEVIRLMDLPPGVTEVMANNGRRTLIEERLGWARVYLKKSGLINNSERGVWALTKDGKERDEVEPKKLARHVRQQLQEEKQVEESEPIAVEDESTIDTDAWRDILLATLQGMDPSAFERLCQRLMRESGFIQVEVTGRSGDGGIDGHGIVKIANLLSFTTIFQAKRYQGSVGAQEIRNFRGAMVGRADKGLFITTGSFTPAAYSEATRDGAPPIDLVDGEQLVMMLKELRLGISVEVVEVVEVHEEWFHEI